MITKYMTEPRFRMDTLATSEISGHRKIAMGWVKMGKLTPALLQAQDDNPFEQTHSSILTTESDLDHQIHTYRHLPAMLPSRLDEFLICSPLSAVVLNQEDGDDHATEDDEEEEFDEDEFSGDGDENESDEDEGTHKDEGEEEDYDMDEGDEEELIDEEEGEDDHELELDEDEEEELDEEADEEELDLDEDEYDEDDYDHEDE